MNSFEVSVEGYFRREFYVNAETEAEADKLAREQFKKEVGLSEEDFVIDSVDTIPESL